MFVAAEHVHPFLSASRWLLLQSVFIVFQDKIKPGKNYTGSQLFDNGGAFYNVPGYLDNLKVSSST